MIYKRIYDIYIYIKKTYIDDVFDTNDTYDLCDISNVYVYEVHDMYDDVNIK